MPADPRKYPSLTMTPEQYEATVKVELKAKQERLAAVDRMVEQSKYQAPKPGRLKPSLSKDGE